MHTVTVSTRSRNIGLGWTNQPEQRYSIGGASYLAIADVEAPDYTGTPRYVRAQLQRAARGNSGNDWRWVLFVGDRRVIGDGTPLYNARETLDALCEPGSRFDLQVED